MLVLACGGFVAAEFSFVTVDRATVERAVENKERGADGVLKSLRTLSTQLSGAQLGITITNLAIGYMSEPAVASLLEGPLESVGVPEGAISTVALILALFIATSVTMIIGELVPKNMAIARPMVTAKAVQRFQRGFTALFKGPISLFNACANWILRRMGIEPQEELASARSAEELQSLVRRSAQEGTLEAGTATLLARSLEFGERRAEDVMTPRVRMRALGADEPISAVIELARESGFSRFPVTGTGPDEVVGIIHVKHAVAVPVEERATTPISAKMADPVVVPDSLELDALLEQLRVGGLQMAIVVDEYGGVDGVVTMEDLVEEIVGEVVDEHDTPEEAVVRTPQGWLVSGLLRPDEAGRAIGLSLPEDDEYETLGGLIALHKEHIPEVGDEVVLDVRDTERNPRTATLKVVRMDGMRVDRIRVTDKRRVVEEDGDE